jgi:3-hydroxybutyryl-CoA dehydratase
MIALTMADLSYQGIEMNREYGPYYYPLSERIGRHLDAIEAEHAWLRERAPWGPPMAPPTILATAALRFIDWIAPMAPGTLHVKQELEIGNGIRQDRTPTGYGKFVEKYERRGRRWFVFEAGFRDETGLLLARSRSTLAFPEKVDTEDEPREKRKPAERKGELKAITRTLTQDKMTAFAEDSANSQRGTSIHVQPEAAKAAGFSTTVAHGLITSEYISDLMIREIGKGWLLAGRLSVAFVGSPLCGDTITTNGRLVERIDEGSFERLVYEVWCENQRGEAVTVGTASGLTPTA